MGDPTVKEWAGIFMDIYKMEKFTFKVNLKMDIFTKHWNRWENYIKQYRPEVV